MKYLLLAFIFSIFSSCYNSKNNGNDNGDGNNGQPGATQANTIAVKEWSKLDTSLFGVTSPSMSYAPVVSHDKKWLYLPTKGAAGSIVALDIGDDFAKHVVDKNKWSKLSWVQTGFDGSAAAKAQLSDTGTMKTINPTADGLLVAWEDTSGGSKHGAIYVKGNKISAVWQSVKMHITGIKKRTLVINNFFTVDKSGVAVPYLLTTDTKPGNTNSLFTHDKLESDAFDVEAGFSAVANKLAQAKFAQSSTKAFLVSRLGISMLDVSDAGTNTNFSDVNARTNVLGSNKWNMGNATIQNINVEYAMVAGDKLYIAFGAIDDHQGGVAIYDITNNKIIAPEYKIWNGITVRSLTVDKDGKVWAITKSELIEVKSDGTMGEKLNAAKVVAEQAKLTGDQPSPGYKGEMPATGIFGAVFFGDSMFLHTQTDVYLMTTKSVSVPK